jgi:hypothetical protein
MFQRQMNSFMNVNRHFPYPECGGNRPLHAGYRVTFPEVVDYSLNVFAQDSFDSDSYVGNSLFGFANFGTPTCVKLANSFL